MLQDLEAYLDATTTPETASLISETCQTLLDAGVDSHLFVLRNAMDEAQAQENDIVLELTGILITTIRSNLKEFGIKASDEADLKTLHSIFKGLQLIDKWDDPDSLNVLTDASIEGEESCLADILNVVGDLSVGEYMVALESVSEDLITRIAEMTRRDNDGPQPDEIVVAGCQHRLRFLLAKHVPTEDSLFVKAMDNGLRLGMSFEVIIEEHLNDLAALPVKKMAWDMVAFAYASSTPSDGALLLLNKLKESFNLNINDLLQLDAEIKRLL